MAAQALGNAGERGHLVGDVPALLIMGIALLALAPRKPIATPVAPGGASEGCWQQTVFLEGPDRPSTRLSRGGHRAVSQFRGSRPYARNVAVERCTSTLLSP